MKNKMSWLQILFFLAISCQSTSVAANISPKKPKSTFKRVCEFFLGSQPEDENTEPPSKIEARPSYNMENWFGAIDANHIESVVQSAYRPLTRDDAWVRIESKEADESPFNKTFLFSEAKYALGVTVYRIKFAAADLNEVRKILDGIFIALPQSTAQNTRDAIDWKERLSPLSDENFKKALSAADGIQTGKIKVFNHTGRRNGGAVPGETSNSLRIMIVFHNGRAEEFAARLLLEGLVEKYKVTIVPRTP